MYATTPFPQHLHWDSFQLADAVPRRLSELHRFDARIDAPAARSANGEPRRPPRDPRPYAPASGLPALFRVD